LQKLAYGFHRRPPIEEMFTTPQLGEIDSVLFSFPSPELSESNSNSCEAMNPIVEHRCERILSL
jgi:hypothetical protein